MSRDTRVFLACIAALGAMLVVVARADANRQFVVAEQHPGGQVARPDRFGAIIGFPDQCVAGIPCWIYTKGTRSGVDSWPETWYVHQDGARIRDSVYNTFVMDPREAGWRREAARECPHRCFLDGLGTSAISRTRPRLQWSVHKWVRAVAGEVRYVRTTGDRVLPNSVGFDSRTSAIIAAAGGQGSTEAYSTASARRILGMGRMWISEKGKCLGKWNAFRRWAGRRDHFACYQDGKLPWNRSWMP